MQSSANWAELLEPGLHDIFHESGKKLPDHRALLFNTLKSKKSAEHSLGRGGIGMMQPWDDTGNSVSYDEIAKGYKTTFTHVKYSNGLQIERELWDDDQFDEINGMAADLSFSVWYTRQYHAASVFNNAFNDTYAGADAVALCSTAHPYSPSNASTWSNKGTYELTAANVETVRNLMKLWKDDRGNVIPMHPDTLLVPPNLRKAALVIAGSEKEPDTADNNVNVWKGSLKVIEWELLTDTTNWFMIDSQKMKRFLIWWDRRIPKLERDGPIFDTELAKWKVIGRWSYGWKSARFIYGNNAA